MGMGPFWDWAMLQCVYPHSDPQQYEYYLTTLVSTWSQSRPADGRVLHFVCDLRPFEQRVHVAVAPGYDCTFDVHCHDDVPVTRLTFTATMTYLWCSVGWRWEPLCLGSHSRRSNFARTSARAEWRGWRWRSSRAYRRWSCCSRWNTSGRWEPWHIRDLHQYRLI